MACVTLSNGKKIRSAHLSQWVIPLMGCNWAYPRMLRTELFTFGISLTLARSVSDNTAEPAMALVLVQAKGWNSLPSCASNADAL